MEAYVRHNVEQNHAQYVAVIEQQIVGWADSFLTCAIPSDMWRDWAWESSLNFEARESVINCWNARWHMPGNRD